MSPDNVAAMHAKDVIIVAGFGLVALLGGFVTMLCFRIVDRGIRDRDRGERSTPEANGEVPTVEAAGAKLRGGAWIGVLERIAIYAGLLAGWPEVIAITLAVKGLARYPELKAGDRTAVAERFIIGTFVSVLWACGCAGLAHWLIS